MSDPLTKDEILEILREISDEEINDSDVDNLVKFVRIIEEAHGI